MASRSSRTGFKTVSGAGPVREQPHGLLGPTSTVTGDGPAAGRGAPRSRPPAIGFESSSRHCEGFRPSDSLTRSLARSFATVVPGVESTCRLLPFAAIIAVAGLSLLAQAPSTDQSAVDA